MLHMCSGIASREGEEATPRPRAVRRSSTVCDVRGVAHRAHCHTSQNADPLHVWVSAPGGFTLCFAETY
eukprot:scaffold41266_cov48-Phaeocystis_antarctica.AAC.1